MASYPETLVKIRAARQERDKAKDQLYALQLRHIALKKAQKKIVSRDIVVNENTRTAIAEARKRKQALQAKLIKIEEELRQFQQWQQLLTDALQLQEKLQAEAEDIKEKLATLRSESDDPAVSAERKKELTAKIEQLQAQLAALEKRLEDLKATITRLRRQIESSQQRKQELEGEKKRTQSGIAQVDEELNGLIHNTDNQPGDNGESIDATRRDIEKQIIAVKGKEKAIGELVTGLFVQQTPQQLIEEWDDKIPVMLFPVRMETKFKIEGAVKELWVRIFPDDIAIVTHEKVLTQQEIDYGIAYWKALWNAGNDEDKKKNAWRMLTDKFGANRSAWVASQTKPSNWGDAAITNESDLQFPSFDLNKPDSWTEAPHTRIMPDRFVLMGYNNGELKLTATGAQVNDIVVVGPSPMDDPDNPSITRDETDNRLKFSEDMQWLPDFGTAVKNGLGFKIALTDEMASRGFDQLLVLGVKHSADDTDGKQLLEDLIDNHHYSKKGISLVTQGTPTNNTDEKDAGFSSKDPLQSLSYFVETGQSLFEPTDIKEEATDGQRLADYLGIKHECLQYVANSNSFDHREAVAMNKSLYAGTLGYYLHSMLNEVMDDHTIGKLRHHFNNYVTGRGPIAAIRVGTQPYGILLTSAFAKWKYGSDQAGLPSVILRGDNFYPVMYNILASLEQRWKQLEPQLNHISKKGSAGTSLMSVLGLNPTSVEYFQRVGYSVDNLKNLEWFMDGGTYFSDLFIQQWNQMMIPALLQQFGYTRKRSNGTDKPVPLLLQLIFRHYHTQLDAKNLIDGQPLSEELNIKPYDEGTGENYIHWLLKQTTSKQLEEENFGGVAKPNSLLYMMLRHSILLETSQSIYNFLTRNNIEAYELIRSRKFANITAAPTVSHWEIFDAPANQLVKTDTSAKGLFELIHSPRFDAPADRDIVANLKEQKDAFGILKDMKTARLERAMAEHLDTLTYRLDAWQTSLFDTRLRAQRNLDGPVAKQRTGSFIGAYCYMENVRQGRNKRVKIADDVLPLPLRENKDNLFVETPGGGYVHAPSLNHATAAALLRNGYLTHASPAEREMLSVNLSSERVRRAMYLIEGVRNGLPLEVLLGYQFERGLHEWSTRNTNPVILNDLLPDFRKAFPIKKTRVPQEGNVTGPEETIEDYHVVNGLELARTTTAAPYITVTPALSTAKINAIKTEKENITNTLDAMRDILTSESAYQLAMGNFDRAAAVMQSISNSQIPPDIEVINTARGTTISFTNRMVIHFDPLLTTNPWAMIDMTERAATEPGINHWIGSLIGDPAKIRCSIKAVDKDGNTLQRGDGTDIAGMISLQDLKVQPADFIYLIRNKLEESGTSELETRVRYEFAEANSLSDATIVKIEFANSNSGGDLSIRSFAEILPFANYIREIISSSRELGARDFQIASKEVTKPGDNPNNINVPELQGRVETVFANFGLLFTQLESAVSDTETLKTEITVNELRARLFQIANAGFVFAFPQSAFGFSQEQIDVLVVQGKSLLKRFEDIKLKYNEGLTIVNNVNTKPPAKISLLTSMLKLMLGDDFVVMTRFSFTNAAEVAQSFTNRAELLEYAKTTLGMSLVTDEWLHGASLVRPKMHVFEMIRLLNDSLNTSLIDPEPIQLPYRDHDSWLAVEFPAGTTIDHDTLSFIQYKPQGFNPAGEQCGLLIDEWTESIPNREEVTGITFNYNQPNSVPPQAILLTVTPEETGHWKWNNLADSVLDTFRRAKLRAVEPDMLDQQGGITTLFPAIISEFSTSRTNISLDYSFNLVYVSNAVAAMQVK